MPRTPKRLAMNNTLVQWAAEVGTVRVVRLEAIALPPDKDGIFHHDATSVAPSCTASISVHLVGVFKPVVLIVVHVAPTENAHFARQVP